MSSSPGKLAVFAGSHWECNPFRFEKVETVESRKQKYKWKFYRRNNR